jgi:large subunit ribosomal protein L18e
MKTKRLNKLNNRILIDTIKSLKEASKSSGKKIWKALAKDLDKPKRKRVAVNLSRINRYTDEGQVVAVPGKVLAAGWLDHEVTIAAFSFSELAKEKIKQAKGESMNLIDLPESGIEPKNIKIMK